MQKSSICFFIWTHLEPFALILPHGHIYLNDMSTDHQTDFLGETVDKVDKLWSVTREAR